MSNGEKPKPKQKNYHERATQLNAPTDFSVLSVHRTHCVRLSVHTIDGSSAVYGISPLSNWSMWYWSTAQGPIDSAECSKRKQRPRFYLLLILPVFCEQIASSRRAAFFFSLFFCLIVLSLCDRRIFVHVYSIRVVRFGRPH